MPRGVPRGAFKHPTRRAPCPIYTFQYDAGGRLVRRDLSGAPQRHYLWDGDQLLAELDAAGTTKLFEYAYYPGLDQFQALIESTTPYFAHRDGLGNVIALTDAAKTVQRTYSYDDWGNTTGGTDTHGFGNLDRARWKGALWTSSAGGDLYYMRNRWYEPYSGRFLSEDPLGLAGGLNQYAYAGNDAVDGSDPSGLYVRECSVYAWVTRLRSSGWVVSISQPWLGNCRVIGGIAPHDGWGATRQDGGGGGGDPKPPRKPPPAQQRPLAPQGASCGANAAQRAARTMLVGAVLRRLLGNAGAAQFSVPAGTQLPAFGGYPTRTILSTTVGIAPTASGSLAVGFRGGVRIGTGLEAADLGEGSFDFGNGNFGGKGVLSVVRLVDVYVSGNYFV
jgi:RHS repeat-associated protein